MNKQLSVGMAYGIFGILLVAVVSGMWGIVGAISTGNWTDVLINGATTLIFMFGLGWFAMTTWFRKRTK